MSTGEIINSITIALSLLLYYIIIVTIIIIVNIIMAMYRSNINYAQDIILVIILPPIHFSDLINQVVPQPNFFNLIQPA